MEYSLKNMMEPLVEQKIRDNIDRLNCCRCDRCLMDIAAHALNHLPPKYVATHQGELFSRVDALSPQYSADVMAAIAAAADAVRNHPRH